MRRKRLGCFILTMFLSLSLVLPANSYAAGKFSDTAGHWAETYINTAVNKKIITGYPDGRFLPDKAVTRAEFATMVNKALGNTATESLSFGDVPSREWYYNDVAKAVAAAYTAGYDDNTFRPNNPITRQEAAVMISRIVPSYGASGNLKAFSDYRSIADWAYDSMDKVNGKKYMGAYNDGKIHPTDKLTRAQTAKIICDILEKETIVTGGTTINRDGTRLSDRIYANDVSVDKNLREDSATIDNCVILGNLSVRGGGTDTITINNSRVASATVNKDDDPVRILAKGETSIVKLSASQDSILQTSSLSGGLFGPGFNNITVNGSADVTLKGSFPKVNITGNQAKVTLDSGTVDALTVSGRYSDITAASGATIKAATVNAESYFHGSGTISQMNVNANGVTYETKPRNWTIASSVSTPKQADEVSSITYSPKNGATNVKLDAKITITFSEAMTLYDGGTITNSDIDDFVELRKDTAGGSLVDYSASINSAKTVITITPDSNLTKNTRYFIVIDKNSIRDRNKNGNTDQSIYFNTGSDYGSVTTTFSPADGAANIAVNPSITISFSEGVVQYKNGTTISSSDSYLKECIVFKKTDSRGADVNYNVSINSAKKVITITPKSNLDIPQKYYLALVSNKLKTKDSGETIPAKSVTWTTGVTTPTVNTLTLSPGETTITATLTANVAGTAYFVVLPSADKAPSAEQVVAGQNGSGVVVSANYRTNGTVAANTAKAFSFSEFASSTSYKVYAVVRANNVNSAVKSESTTTVRPVTRLSELEAIPAVSGVPNPGNQISFSPSTTTYNVTLNSNITTLTVKAKGSGRISIDGDTAVENTAIRDVSLGAGNQTIQVTIAKDGTDGTTYNIVVNRAGNADISSLTVTAGGSILSDSGGRSYQVTAAGDVNITITVAAADKFAEVILEGDAATIGTGSKSFNFPAGSSERVFEFRVVSGSDSANYKVTLVRPAPPSSEGGSSEGGVTVDGGAI